MSKWYHIITAIQYYQENYVLRIQAEKAEALICCSTFTALIELYFVLQLDYVG